MNRTTRLIGLGLLVSVCAAAIAAVGPITIKYTPKEGDVLKYKMNSEVQVMGCSGACCHLGSPMFVSFCPL